MRNAFRKRFLQRGFALQVVLPIALLMMTLVSAALIAAYQTRAQAFRASYRNSSFQWEQDGLRQCAVAFAEAVQTGDIALADISTRLAAAFTPVNPGTGTVSGNFDPLGLHVTISGPAPSDMSAALTSGYSTLVYPNIRLALVSPGANFVAKQIGPPGGVPVEATYSGTDPLSTNATDMVNWSCATTVRIYEVPGQFALEGGAINLTSPTSGTVVGSSVTVGATVSGNVVADSSVSWTPGVSVGGSSLAAQTDAQGRTAGFVERLQNSAGSGFSNQVSVAQETGAAVLAQVGDRAADAETAPNGVGIQVPHLFQRPPSVRAGNAAAAGTWEMYSYPYYAAKERIYSANGTVLSRGGGPGAGQIVCSLGNGVVGDASGAGATAESPFPSSAVTFSVVSNSPLGQVLVATVDVSQIQAQGGSQSLFIDLITDVGHAGAIVALNNAGTLNFPLSIVSANPIVFLTDFNTTGKPASVLAPLVLPSTMDGFAPSMNMTGTRAASSHSGTFNPFQLGTSGASATMNYADITSSTQIPPITLKNWLIVVTPPIQ